MKALLLNSGMGTRLGDLTKEKSKCLIELINGKTILEQQILCMQQAGIDEFIITVGYKSDILAQHVTEAFPNLNVTFVNNERYQNTNYIYSMYLAERYLDSDFILAHGDLVFEEGIIADMLQKHESVIVSSSSMPLSDKDFKAVITDQRVRGVGVELYERAVACQPLYYIKHNFWKMWNAEINRFINKGNVECYAEKALNLILDKAVLLPFDIFDRFCMEIDTKEDLEAINKIMKRTII